MDIDELMTIVARALEAVDIRYMVSGSMATIFYGEPRLTTDVHIVVDLKPEQVRPLHERFPDSEFYFSEEAAHLAIQHGRMFNIIHPSSGLKADLIVAARDQVTLGRLRRARRRSTAPGVDIRFASPEDVILSKLQFYGEGGSDKHLRDIRGVLLSRLDELDLGYIDSLAEQLDVSEIWQQLKISGNRR